MQLALDTSTPFQIRNAYGSDGFILTDRDKEICKFILTMKFSTIEEIFQKFFKRTLKGTESEYDRAASKRLVILERGGLLFSKNLIHHKRKFYFATLKAHRIVDGDSSSQALPLPVRNADYRTFEHDHTLIRLRLLLEEECKVTNWTSDRQLKCNPELIKGFEAQYVPDGICTFGENERVALELEITQKSKTAYQDKLRKYVVYLRSTKPSKAFSKVIFICKKESIYKILEQETKIYRDLFEIKRLSDYQNQQPQLTK